MDKLNEFDERIAELKATYELAAFYYGEYEGEQGNNRGLYEVDQEFEKRSEQLDAARDALNVALAHQQTLLSASERALARCLQENTANSERADKWEGRAKQRDAEAADLEAVIIAMWPMFSAALGYCEHGRYAEMRAMKDGAEAFLHNQNYDTPTLFRVVGKPDSEASNA